MDDCRAGCFDVYYYEGYAKACCIVFESGPAERVISLYSELVRPIRDYFPGKFYKRELPCILKVYEKVEENLDLLIIDGFVLLGKDEKGLGGYLFESLDGKIPVIGVAKTFFRGSSNYMEVYRGNSSKPLFVSSLGVDLDAAAAFIKNLKGDNRLPDILKRVDRLTRSDL